jgi:hypothetical protein
MTAPKRIAVAPLLLTWLIFAPGAGGAPALDRAAPFERRWHTPTELLARLAERDA